MSHVCCPTDLKPVSSNYARKGVTSYLTGLNEDDCRSKDRAIVLIPDIFSFHPNAHQVADMLAHEGYTVLIPNFFGESSGWPVNEPIDFNSEEWGAFYTEHVSQFDRHVATVEKSVKFLKALGATRIGSIAMCWGSKVVSLVSQKHPDMFSVLVLPHPSFFTVDECKGFKMPTYLMASDGEKEEIMIEVEKNLKSGNGVSVHERFSGLHHGFIGARGYLPGSLSRMPDDYMKATEVALNKAISFFKLHL